MDHIIGAGLGRVIWWAGVVPSTCDACHAPLSGVFVDCKTTNGLWGSLCVACAGELAVASGPPLTRVFQATPDGWVSIF